MVVVSEIGERELNSLSWGVRVLVWVGWDEHSSSWDVESLDLWVVENSSGEVESSLEWVSWDEGGVGVVSDPLEGSEPGPGVLPSLSELVGLVGASVKFDSHLLSYIIGFINGIM